jgi:hypothetical protein
VADPYVVTIDWNIERANIGTAIIKTPDRVNMIARL